MAEHEAGRMKEFWDDAARRNAAWYVDTSLDFDHPDQEQFLATGGKVVAQALDNAPVAIGRGTAVEIGPGVGRICLALAERFDRVIGVDISPEMVERARELAPDPRIRFEVGDGTSLKAVETASADVVLSFTVFQHIPSVPVIEGYVAEAARVLKPGGLFVFQWNGENGALYWRLRRSVLAALQRTGVRSEQHQRHAPEFLGSRVPVPRMRTVLDASGFDLRRLEGEGTLFTWAWAVRR